MAIIFLATVLALIPLLFSVYTWFCGRNSGGKFPPSPPALPVLGHFHLLGRRPHRSVQKISQKYGPLVRLRLGSTSVVFACSAGAAQEILRTQDRVFSSRPYNMTADMLAYESRDLILAPYGDYWRKLKALCKQELLSEKNIAVFQGVRMEEVSSVLEQLREASRKDEDFAGLRTLLYEFTYNTLTQMLVGKCYCGPRYAAVDTEETQQFKLFMTHVREAVILSGLFHLGDYFPSLKWLDPNAGRMDFIHMSMDFFLSRVLAEHRQKKFPDFLTTVLATCTEEQDENIKAFMGGLVAAGTDAISAAIEWALAELLHHPEILKKVQDEIDGVVANNQLVQEADLSRLKYLHAIITETFRLHPPAPFTVVHMSTEDCEIASYQAPKGTRAYVNIFAIGRDPTVWENPEVFNPERFMEPGKEAYMFGHEFELIPFGAGRRKCPGSGIGRLSIQLVLANLLHSFEWRAPPGHLPCLEERFGTVAAIATPLKVRVSPR